MTETVVTIDPNRNPQSGQPKPPNTTTTTQLGGLSWVQCNIGYFKTLPGILKLVQVVLGIICMACPTGGLASATSFFLSIAVLAFICSVLWSFAYLLGIREALTIPINWILTEFLNTALVAGFYFIAFIVQLSKWSGAPFYYGRNIAAGVFGIFNTLAYAAGVYFLWVEHKSGSTQ